MTTARRWHADHHMLTGLLLVGRESALQQSVKFNEFRRYPLLKAGDWLLGPAQAG